MSSEELFDTEFDLDELEGSGGGIVPTGTYEATLTEVPQMSGQKGWRGLALAFEIAADAPQAAGRRVRSDSQTIAYEREDVVGYSRKFLTAAALAFGLAKVVERDGTKKVRWETTDPDEIIAEFQGVIGSVVQIKVKHKVRKRNGTAVNRDGAPLAEGEEPITDAYVSWVSRLG